MTGSATNTGHPAPEVDARPALVDEIPKTAQKLHDLAVTHGWSSWVTYARGTRIGSSKVTDSIAVRMHKADQRLVGLWVDGAFSTGLARNPLAVLKSRELAARVKA